MIKMKTLIIALLISSLVSGQKPASHTVSAEWIQASYMAKDTVPVLLLISDTSINNRIHTPFVINGYEVLANGFGYREDMTPFSMKYFVVHLDANKCPLPKTWVVWQAKTRLPGL